MKPQITKTTIECYKLRYSNGHWADITIDAKDNTGRIQIASDFGSWQNYWGACGSDFKTFLLGLDIHYAANKFGEGNYFDVDKTISLHKKQIIEARKSESISEEMARELFEKLDGLNEASTSDIFCHLWYEDNKLFNYFEHPDLCRDISPMFQRFWDIIWKPFCDELRSEVQLISNP